VAFQGFARRKIFLLVRRGDEPSPTALLCGTLRGLRLGHGQPRVCGLHLVGSRLPRPYHFRRGFNLFKPLRRHFRARPGPEPRVCGTRLPRGEILSAFSEFSMLCEAENFPLVHRRRIRQSPTKLAGAALLSRGRWLSDGTCGNARPWRFPLVTKGIRTTYHDFVSQKGKIRKSRRQPSRQEILGRQGTIDERLLLAGRVKHVVVHQAESLVDLHTRFDNPLG
jgi:hypothetical protein